MSAIRVAFGQPTPRYEGIKVPVQIFDATSTEVWAKPMPLEETGSRVDRDLRAGTYLVRATLPSGEILAETVAVESDRDVKVVLKPRGRSLNHELSWDYTGRSTLPEFLWTEIPKISLWARDDRGWRKLHRNPRIAVTIDRELQGKAFSVTAQLSDIDHPQELQAQIWLQLGISTGSMFMAVPFVQWSRFLITTNDDEQAHLPFRVHPSSCNAEIDSLLGFLDSGDFESARAVGNGWMEHAERMLHRKLENPMAAAVGGYFLLMAGELDRLHDWTNNLAEWFEWLPDGAIIRAYHLMTESEPDVLRIRAFLLKAVNRGLPYYRIGLRLLRDGLKILSQQFLNDPEIHGALDIVGPYLEAVDHSSTVTAFSGKYPETPRSSWRSDEIEEATGPYQEFRVDLSDRTEPKRVFDLLSYQQAHFPKQDAIAGKLDGHWVRYPTDEVISIVERLACGLQLIGIRAGDHVANITETNRPEWNFIDMAILSLGAVHVPIHSTLSTDDYRHIFSDSKPCLIFVSNQRLLDLVGPIAEEIIPTCREIFTYEETSIARSFKELLAVGEVALRDVTAKQKLLEARAAVKPDDFATLIYTAGTSGRPKGVQLSHTNLVSNCIAVADILRPCGCQRAVSLLPLCNVHERTITYVYLFLGTSIYYAEDFNTFAENLCEVRPDTFSTVPRLLEKIYERFLSKGEQLSGLKRRTFFWALDLALNVYPDCSLFKRLQLAVADFLVFRKWRDTFGGRISGIVSGSTALDPRMASVFWAAGIPVWEGYGLAEASAVISVNRPKTSLYKLGTVGPVIPGGEVKIAEDGEIFYRGPNVMMGYYGRPDLTREAIDRDGWLHTGDVGEMDGPFLKITDRKKAIFKTSGGKYIAPQQVENQLKESRFIAQCIVIGENHKFPAALIVPQFDAVQSWLAAQGESIEDRREMAKHPKVIELIQGEIDHSNSHFGRYSQVKKFALLEEEWTIASGELTPTLQLKRNRIIRKYVAAIESLYQTTDPSIVSNSESTARWQENNG